MPVDIVERINQHDLNVCLDWRDETDCKAWIDLADELLSEAANEIATLRQQLEESRERNLIANERADSAQADLERFRSERSYVVGCNTGWDEAIEQAAQITDKPVAWRWDQVMSEGDWQTAFTEHGEPEPSATMRNVVPLYSHPPTTPHARALTRALEFIESLTAEPLLMGVDDIEMTIEDVQDHARIELASIRAALTAAPASDAEPVKMKPLEWEDCGELGWCADTIVGRYWVDQVHVAFRTRLVTLVAENETWIDIVDGKGFEAAKNAAQADYEARIRSAILPIDT